MSAPIFERELEATNSAALQLLAFVIRHHRAYAEAVKNGASVETFESATHRAMWNATAEHYRVTPDAPPGDAAIALRINRPTLDDVSTIRVASSQPEAFVKALVVELEEQRVERAAKECMKRSAVAAAADDAETARKYLDDAAELRGLRDEHQTGSACTLAEAANAAIESVFHRGDEQLTTTGLPCLDQSIGGLEAGNMLGIAADTSVGKSSLMLSMACGMAEKGVRVGIINCEDSRGVIGARAAGRWCSVSPLRMRSGATEDDLHRLGELADALPDLPVYLEFQIGKSEDAVLAAMRRLVHRHRVRVVFIDYAQCILSANPNAPRKDQVRDMTARFKGAAASLGVSLVLLSQLSRPTQADRPGREPSIHHMKETGDLENSCEVILLLWVPDHEKPNQISMKIGKAKWGARKRLFQLVRTESGALEEQSFRVAGADADEERTRGMC